MPRSTSRRTGWARPRGRAPRSTRRRWWETPSGPALNILIKLMTMMSLVFAEYFPIDTFDRSNWWIALIVMGFFLVVAFGITFWMRKTGFGKIDYGDKDKK